MSSRLRRVMVAIGAAGIAAIVPASQGLAWVDWCDSDPPVHLITPAGHAIEINNFLGSTHKNQRLLKRAIVYGYVEPAGPGHSLVHIVVILPEGGDSHVHVRAQTDRFGQSADTDLEWGEEAELELTVAMD